MAQAQRIAYISEEDYLASEELSPVKREYVDGHVFAMAGATNAHNVITLNVGVYLHAHLRGSACRAYVNDMKARIQAINTYYYPDVMVSCGVRNPTAVFTETPVLIVEVISRSTETTDRREKLMNYRKIPTLREYVLIEQRKRCLEVYRLNDDGEWEHETIRGKRELELTSLPNGTCSISLDDIYEGVILAA
jgi:Uma2 family endonuclease